MSIAIRVENLSKAYQIGQIGTGTISRDLERWWTTKVLGREDPFLKLGETNDRSVRGESNVVWSLKDINFEIEQGDAIGIIGKNGAGKSTLLKLLSRVTSPTKGKIKVKGRVASLLEVGTGFHPELTGRENIYLNGSILGMRKKEIDRKFDEIVDFSGIERYIDTPVKRYSSGMYVRLAFAVAAHLESEILIVDEVLAVGDAEFQKKCLGKMGEVSKRQGRSVLFVSHNMGAVSQLCSKALLIENGSLTNIGNVDQIVNKYLQLNNSKEGKYILKLVDPKKKAQISTVILYNDCLVESNIFRYCENIDIKINILQHINLKNATLYVCILDTYNNRIFSAETVILEEKNEYMLRIDKNFLAEGNYQLFLNLHELGVVLYDKIEETCQFEVIDDSSPFMKYSKVRHGFVFGKYKWI